MTLQPKAGHLLRNGLKISESIVVPLSYIKNSGFLMRDKVTYAGSFTRMLYAFFLHVC